MIDISKIITAEKKISPCKEETSCDLCVSVLLQIPFGTPSTGSVGIRMEQPQGFSCPAQVGYSWGLPKTPSGNPEEKNETRPGFFLSQRPSDPQCRGLVCMQ